MELLINLYTFLIIPLLFLILLKTCKQMCKNELVKTTAAGQRKCQLPPGPWKLPIIGNLLQLAGSLPHHAITALSKKHGPIMHLQFGELSTIVISSAKLAKEALMTHDLALASRPPLLTGKIIFYDCTDVGLSPYGMYWRQMRKACTLDLLSASKVRSFRSLREEEVSSFIESIRTSSGSPFNFTKMIYSLQTTIIFRATIGEGCKDQDALIDLLVEIFESCGGFDISDLFPSYKLLHFLFGSSSKLRKLHKKLDRILDNILEEHREKQGARSPANEDLLDALLRRKEDGSLQIPITFSNIKAVIVDMLTGGTDTAATTIGWAMAEMMRNPRVMEKAQAELRQILKGKNTVNETDIRDLRYLKLVVKETLRLHTPSPLLAPRLCMKQCEVGGYVIPVDIRFIVNAWAISRDPEYWHDPESFVPERFEDSSIQFHGTNFEYIPFGAGRRMCPGLSFGIANVELSLAQLLYHFNWRLPDGMKPEDLDMSETFGVTAGMKNQLHLVATPYSQF